MPKKLSTVEWFYMESNPKTPKSTTREMLESGRLGGTRMRIITRKQLNFQSYPMADLRVVVSHADAVHKRIAWTTSYRQDFVSHFPQVCPTKWEVENTPDTAFNRKPVSDFPSTELSPHKFMDDHFVNLSENRKKINFLRQLRNAHFKLI